MTTDFVVSLAGPLALARAHLTKDSDPFFVLNSDIICDFPFKDMIRFQKHHGKQGTLVVSELWFLREIPNGKMYILF